MRVIPRLEGRERRLCQGPAQVPPYPRHMTQILWFAVPTVEAGKNPKDFRGALRRHQGVERDEIREVELRVVDLACLGIAAQQGELHGFRYVDAGVLQQRGHVVGGRSDYRVLEIEQADARNPGAVAKPQQV